MGRRDRGRQRLDQRFCAGLKCRVAARQLAPRPSLRIEPLCRLRIPQNHWHHSCAMLT